MFFFLGKLKVTCIDLGGFAPKKFNNNNNKKNITRVFQVSLISIYLSYNHLISNKYVFLSEIIVLLKAIKTYC